MNTGVVVAIVLALGWGSTSFANDRSVAGVFCGSTPCGETIRQLLNIPTTTGAPELIEWNLTLYRNSRYELRCRYGATVPNKPGLQKDVHRLERDGAWSIGKGMKSNFDATVYELEGGASFFQVDSNILHVLNPDRSLMFATSGWSYTLNRMEHAEKPPSQALVLDQPDMSYQIAPLASGPNVFGVFEGRSPCQGIARELKSPVHAGCSKIKWRVTLYQDPKTQGPAAYKVEGSLHRRRAREGTWTITRGTPRDPKAVVYQLAAKDEPTLFLLKGDDNVLFFLDQNRNPMVGHCDFSYTLNRRVPAAEAERAAR